MNTIEAANLSTIRTYLEALQDGAVGAALARFFTSDAEQVELPNRLNPTGGVSDLPTLLRRAEQEQKLLWSQRYDGRLRSQRNYDCFEPW